MLPHNVYFLIALLVIMAAVVVFTFVFVILVDRSLKNEGRERDRQAATDSEEGS